MIIVDTGLTYAVPTILIAAMTGISNEHNRNEYLTITPEQATWLGEWQVMFFHPKIVNFFSSLDFVSLKGSISNLFQPIGSLLSVFITGTATGKL